LTRSLPLPVLYRYHLRVGNPTVREGAKCGLGRNARVQGARSAVHPPWRSPLH